MRLSLSACTIVNARWTSSAGNITAEGDVRASMTVNAQEFDAAQIRTDAKLRYAAIHFEELRNVERRGNDFERAHQESFLFHFFGVRDSFLHELNVIYECGLHLNKVRMESLAKALKDSGKQSNELKTIVALEADRESWLSRAKEMRDHSAHRHSVPRVYHVGGKRHGEIFLTDTKSGTPVEQDYLQLFESWLGSMKELVIELRTKKP